LYDGKDKLRLRDLEKRYVFLAVVPVVVIVVAVFLLVSPRAPTFAFEILSPENKTYSNAVPLTFTVSETTSWIGYSLDGQANVTVAENTTLSNLSDRSHSLIVYANDTAGNTWASDTVYFTTFAGWPIHMHLTWQNDTAHTITVTWQTNKSDSGDTVLYDTVPRNSEPDLYTYSAQGTHHTYSFPVNVSKPYPWMSASGYIHDVELTGLSPSTTYYFICGGEGGVWSDERAFKTAPLTRSNIRFVVGSDPHFGVPERASIRDKVSQQMGQLDPDFVVIAGDIVDEGYYQSQWDSFFDHMDTYFTGSDDSIPIIPALGNHDLPYWLYYEQFALPIVDPQYEEQWYSLNCGPDIHIIVLNSEAKEYDGAMAAQTRWLEEDLEAHSSFPWKFAVFHRNDKPFKYGWDSLFDEYDVDIVFNGHWHGYFRTEQNGTMYVVTAAWEGGAFVLVDIFQDGTLHLQAKDDTGVTFDDAWVHKTLPQIGMELVGPLTEKTSEPVDPAKREHVPRAAAWNSGPANAFTVSLPVIALSYDDELRCKAKLIRRRL